MHTYIERSIEGQMMNDLKNFPAVALLGPRQCGKSTLAKKLRESFKKFLYIDLEKPSDKRRLRDPELFLTANKDKLICLDEIQNVPELFSVLRSMIDENKRNGQFLILGSASRDLIKQSSESLAGRLVYCELTPFTYSEIGKIKEVSQNTFWLRGGFPKSLLTENDQTSFQWRESFIRSFLERDIPQLGIKIPTERIRQLWLMCAHNQGQILNGAKLAASLGVSYPTIRSYIDLLTQTFMIRVLEPYSNNLKKRLIKSPKIYIRDSGILHALLEIEDFNELLGHPVLGESWEGFCLENILSSFPEWRSSYYRTSNGTEIDLILERGQRKVGIEFKYSSDPELSKGFYSSLDELHIPEAWVITPLGESSKIDRRTTVTSLTHFLKEFRTK